MTATVHAFPTLGTLVQVRNVAGDLVARVDQALAANVVALARPTLPRRHVAVSSWHEINTVRGISTLSDTTCGQWLTICGARTEFTDLGARKHEVTCTRINDHTGRHAAGAFGRIVAVWEDPTEARP